MVHDRHVNSAMQIQITDISLLMLLLMAVMLQACNQIVRFLSGAWLC